MGQSEVLEVIKKHEKPISRREIAEKLDYDPVKVSHLINKLLKGKEIKCIEVDRFQASKMLGRSTPFRRMRFYYCSDC